jgi:pyrimidine 5'-nucleotidase
MLRYLLFDLDNTLYPDTSGLWEAIGNRINLYMIEKLGMNPHEVTERRENYLNAFGTTLNALRHYYQVDASEFLDFVHDLPLGEYIRYDPDLDGMLERLPLRKVIFTNADAAHAGRVLSILGIGHHFERIIDIRALDFVNKPDLRAYEIALSLISADPEECIFVEDSLLNLLPARKMGFLTVLVGNGAPAEGADYQIRRITELEGFVNELLDARELPAAGGGTSGTQGEALF